MTTLAEIETVVAAYEAALKARQALPERIPIENEELSAQAREANAVIFSAWNALTDVAADAVFLLLPIAQAAVALHEFNKRIPSWGMTPAQELEKVHLFRDYQEAVEKLVGE